MPVSATFDALALGRLLPVAVVDTPAQGVQLADAMLRGGIALIEMTLRTDAGLAAIDAIASQRPEILVGAGTVLSPRQAELAIDAGARFVVSPGFDADIVAACRAREVAVLPGVCTPSEVLAATRLGLTTLKFFPAEQMGGVATLKALRSVFADVKFVPTGGVTPENIAHYLALSNVSACGSSWLADISLVRTGEFDELTRRARETRRQMEVAE